MNGFRTTLEEPTAATIPAANGPGPYRERGPRAGERPRAIDFRRLVGERGWWRLAPAIRQRFGGAAAHRPRRYDGVMTWVENNLAGWLLAHVGRLLGTPLAPWCGRDVPIEVDVFPDRGGNGQVWARRYLFPGGRPVAVSSTKRLDDDGGMMECLDRGFGMKLRVYEDNGRLCFRSLYHFWQAGPFRFRLPHALSPGDTLVVHEDLGHDVFRFALVIRHPWFGEIVSQDGVFAEREIAVLEVRAS